MEFKFIAVNGDNVGDSIGSAIATDNHEELSKITNGLKDAHGAIEQWIESVGGQVVTSSGDEGIYKIPAESYEEATINSLRDQYSQSTGTTITVGIGDSMSEASKALIYGKLNDKDQVVEYDSHIDDYIAGHDVDEEEMPEPDQDEVEDGFTDQEATGDEEYENESAEALVGEEGADDKDPEYQEEVPEMEETPVDGEAAIAETDEAMPDSEPEVSMPADEAVDEHERLVDTLESPSHEDDLEEAQEQSAELEEYKDIAEGDETLAEEGEMSESDLDVAPEDKLDEVVGQDLDGDGDPDTMPPSEEDVDVAAAGSEGDMEEMDEAMMDEGADPMAEEAPEDNQAALTDMIHANMEGDDISPADDEADEEELRQDIVASLQTFRENKPMLEQAKTENPKLYEATILMLRSMIEMAKKLSMDPEADVEAEAAQGDLPDADMADMEEMADEAPEKETQPEDEAVAEEKEEKDEDKDNPFEKKEMIHLYSSLMKSTAVLQRAEKKYWRRELDEKRRKEKERRKRQGKKINGKKPLDHALEEVERKMKVKKEVTSKKKQ